MSGGSPGDDAQRNAIAEFNNIRLPGVDEQSLNLDDMQYLGDYQAQMEQGLNQDDSQMGGISLDPRLREAQMGALESISEMGETGFSQAEEAALRQARRGAAGEAQAKSAQLLDEFSRRGMGGSGAELAARLQAGQSSADRLSQEGDRLSQMSQERALNALSQQANLGSQIRGQEFGEQSDIARAQDAINQFNTANQQNVQSRNVNNTNQAGLRNLSEKQRIGETNTGLSNQQQQHNKELLQSRFNNQMALAGGKAGQWNQLAANQQQAAANDAAMMGSIIGAGAGIAGAAIGGKGSGKSTSDEKAKKDVKPFDVDSFLESLSGVQFSYKEPEKHGEGKQVGVMAQDVEKEAPQLVEEDQEGTKVIDYNKAGGPIFASLAGIHERLKKLEG